MKGSMNAHAGAAGPTLGRGVRGLYGLGLAAEGVKNNAFNMFLLFYYQQVAGLGPITTGLALLVALCVDAVTDPLVGVWSDGLKSRWGRRHPFMYASSIPLAFCFYAVFNPPAGASEALLFVWLVAFACGTRFSMTLFVIPHQSLVAELTSDYDMRTRLQGARVVFAWLFGLVNALLAYTVFLKATAEYPYDPAGFGPFALWGAMVMVITTALSSLGTQRAAIAAQPDAASMKHVRVRDLFVEIRGALASPNYRWAVIGGLLGAVGFGLAENLGNYMNLFFWGFRAQELAVFIGVIALASLTVLTFAPRLASRFGKGRVARTAALVAGLVTPTMVTLKILGVLPEAGSTALLRILCVTVFIGYGAIIVGFVMVGAMIADVTDEHELRTGARQEGLLFAAMTFIAKAASGLAPLVAGIVIKLSGFPDDAKPGAVAPETIQSLGVFAAIFAFAVGVAATLAYGRYRLTREVHRGIVVDLERARRAAAGA
jgi:glycoside/pentoside/hexuronide:cation symporter, GPH family